MDLENKNKWKAEQPFQVPEGYFDRMESEILQRIDLDKPTIKKNARIRSMTIITSIAASIMLLIAAYVVWNLDNEPLEADQYDASIEYVLDNIDEFDLVLISQMSSVEAESYFDLEDASLEDLDPEMMDDELLELFFEM